MRTFMEKNYFIVYGRTNCNHSLPLHKLNCVQLCFSFFTIIVAYEARFFIIIVSHKLVYLQLLSQTKLVSLQLLSRTKHVSLQLLSHTKLVSLHLLFHTKLVSLQLLFHSKLVSLQLLSHTKLFSLQLLFHTKLVSLRLLSHTKLGFFYNYCFIRSLFLDNVPAGSPSRGRDVVVYVKDVNQPSLPTPFYSPNNSLFSYSVLPVLSLPYWSCQLYIFS